MRKAVSQLVRHGQSPQARVLAALAATPRAGYLPIGQVSSADLDIPLYLGYDSTCSQPSTVVTMLALLDVRPGQSVLDVGSGSDWTTALLARLVGPEGRVLGVELVPQLVQDAAERLRRDGLEQASVRVADPDLLGAPEAAPFDRILVSAMAERMPTGLVAQLAPDGLMVLPLDGRLVEVTVRDGSAHIRRTHGKYCFVPLQGD